jgi:hypothetical protein
VREIQTYLSLIPALSYKHLLVLFIFFGWFCRFLRFFNFLLSGLSHGQQVHEQIKNERHGILTNDDFVSRLSVNNYPLNLPLHISPLFNVHILPKHFVLLSLFYLSEIELFDVLFRRCAVDVQFV